jgi:N-glycosylase/DNA lyase
MSIYKEIKKLMKNHYIKQEIKKKLEGFQKNKSFNHKKRFQELCFCILVAGSNLEQTKKAWYKNRKNFLRLNSKKLQENLKKCGCRFNQRALYIIQAKKPFKKINFKEKPFILREILVKNIKGLGMKEASHFLRNLGYKNFAILDRHVLKILAKHKIIAMPKTLTKNKYLEIEKKLEKIAKKLKISQTELDIYLFYLDSKKLPKK